MRQTPTLRLVEALLGESLERWVKPRREMGQSWERLSRDLTRATDGKCRVSDELLRRHFRHIPREPEDSGGAVPPADRRTA